MTSERDPGGKKDEPGFASRWSRLKQEAKDLPETVETDVEPDAPAEDTPGEDTRSDEEVLAELDLPDPDTLKPGDNFAAFMARTVPARLRNRALRKLWVSDPVLANLDELIDYGDDFTDAATVIENLQTSYQVGKGFAGKVTELTSDDAERADKPAGDESDGDERAGDEREVDESGGEQPGEASEETTEAGEEIVVDDNAIDDATEHEAPDPAAKPAIPEPAMAVRQRMRFRVAED